MRPVTLDGHDEIDQGPPTYMHGRPKAISVRLFQADMTNTNLPASLGSTTSIARGFFKIVVEMAINEPSDIMCGDYGNEPILWNS
jgi:hypothetical protein